MTETAIQLVQMGDECFRMNHKARLADLEAERDALKAAIEEISPAKLDLLADWFDADDARKAGERGIGVQADLRRWAKTLRALDTPTTPEMSSEIANDRFDAEGRVIRCVCGGDLRDAPDEAWGISKRCKECFREYT